MSGHRPRPRHYMPWIGLVLGRDRYAVCLMPGCLRVRRAWGKKPLIHKGKKP